MKKFLLKNKWLISIGIFFMFILIVLLILIKTNSIYIFYDSVNKKIRSISIISIIIFLIAFIADIIKGWISNYISDFIFPSADKKILENTNDIKNKTNIIFKRINENSKPYNEIWDSLNELRYYYDKGMQIEIQKTGTIKFLPVFEFRKIIGKHKMNIDEILYKKLEKLNSEISERSLHNMLEPMQLFLDKNNELFPNEKSKIEMSVNENRIYIIKYIENFMQQNKKYFSE